MSIKKKVSLVLHMIKHENIEPFVNCDLIFSFYMINLGGMGHSPLQDILCFKTDDKNQPELDHVISTFPLQGCITQISLSFY